MRPAPAACGDPVAAIDTPALVVDLDAFERNLRAMADFARAQGVKLRPHAKMHKCAAIALRQMALGAVGVCVQKTGEAEALAAAGVSDVFVSNEVIAPAKLARLAALAQRVRLAMTVDSALGIDRLAQAVKGAGSTVDVFIEVDVGQGRCGVSPEQAAALARQVAAQAPPRPGVDGAGLRLAGLQAYHGSAQHFRSAAERAAAIEQAVAIVSAARAAISAAGIDTPLLVTGAGSGTFMLEAGSGVYGELQPGSYAFLDADYARNTPHPDAPRFEHALFVKAQVMSASTTHVVVDAGHKSHAIESGLPTVWQREDLQVVGANDEHCMLKPRGEGAALPALGDTLWLVPGHCDPTVNLHDHLIAVRGGLKRGVVEAVWTVDARGRLD
ncbi:MAG: DSD1 family PLP-dependent enzyme [Methylibium sp.]|uniref:DSD1 family PLP-dependent enzyme n=1 Tax=Methylibium sp. TaxID=2067992 RepID=UPI0017C574DD|nr:DSD1 family PLP-dependent enzyme [Methylibium sp.]MBA3597891.1 DSD1 family PLP-dependent enzyme [Methylibium sp.]